jgi:transposase
VDYLLGPGITAEMLHDDCLGRTLDWLYAHDPTTLFAGIARQARQRFGIGARQAHVDTTSFAVTGEYAPDLDAHTLAVTYGYSRDHRADLAAVDAGASDHAAGRCAAVLPGAGRQRQ